MEGQLATEDMRSQEVPYEILSVNCVVEILVNVFKLAKALHSKESTLTYADFALFRIWLS